MPDRAIQELDTDALADLCRQHNQRYLEDGSGNPDYAYELFRRALAAGDADAWSAAVAIWQPQVRRWIVADGRFAKVGEPAEHFVDLCFLKTKQYIHAANFNSFRNLPSILGYMRRIAKSTLIDYWRKAEREARYQAGAEALETLSKSGSVEASIMSSQFVRRLWDFVRQELKNCLEECVVRLYFREGKKPREIFELYPQFCGDLCGEDELVFEDVTHVQRVKDNLLERLRNQQNTMALTSLVNQFRETAG